MPEGHSVARWANDLRVLVGEKILVADTPARWRERARLLIGERIAHVQPIGKHLFIDCNALVIHGHAMQYGSWQIGGPGMELRKAHRYVRLRLVTAKHEAVFFHGPVMELLTWDELAEHESIQLLGPDLLDPTFDRDEAMRRVRAQGRREIGDVVIDQRVIAGAGNIYNSEGLFLARIDPRRRASGLSDEEIERIWGETIPILREGVAHWGRSMTLPEELRAPGRWNWVYRRRGHPCLRCGTKIMMVRQGELERTTYFCPICQT